MIAAEIDGAPERPKLRLVGRDEIAAALPEPQRVMDAITRDCIYARIRDLSIMFSLAWLKRQETMHVHGDLTRLSDDDLSSLLETMERGREIREDGSTSFSEAGLVRPGTVAI